MFVSAAFYVWFGGWWFGIGLIVLLFVHEMGHVFEAKHQGLPCGVRKLGFHAARRLRGSVCAGVDWVAVPRTG
jgi:membrane-associated protease RseP (regulator of RpoE activity)